MQPPWSIIGRTGKAPCRGQRLSSNVRFFVPRFNLRETQMATKPPAKPKSPMTPAAASRIQGATARANNGVVEKSTFAARAQSAAAKTTSAPAAKAASKTISSPSTGKASKTAAGSALSQVAPKKVTSPAAASAASKTLRDGRTSASSKSAAGSALSQKPPAKKR